MWLVTKKAVNGKRIVIIRVLVQRGVGEGRKRAAHLHALAIWPSTQASSAISVEPYVPHAPITQRVGPTSTEKLD